MDAVLFGHCGKAVQGPEKPLTDALYYSLTKIPSIRLRLNKKKGIFPIARHYPNVVG
jgi:hypothetical protein